MMITRLITGMMAVLLTASLAGADDRLVIADFSAGVDAAGVPKGWQVKEKSGQGRSESGQGRRCACRPLPEHRHLVLPPEGGEGGYQAVSGPVLEMEDRETAEGRGFPKIEDR